MRARFGTRTFVARASAAACRRAMARRFVTFAKYLLERFQISRVETKYRSEPGRHKPWFWSQPRLLPGSLTLAPVFFPGHLDRYFFNEKIGQVFVFIGTTISQRAVLRPSIDRGFRFPGKFSFASISASADRGAAKKKITAAVPIWNTRPFRERKKKRSTGAASVELTVMTAFAVSPEPRSRVRRTFSPGQSDDTRQSASRACGSVASATRAGDDGVAARPARGDERGLGRHGTRGSGVGGDGDRRVARPPLLPSENHSARTHPRGLSASAIPR